MIKNLLFVGLMLTTGALMAQNIQMGTATEVAPVTSMDHAKTPDTVWTYLNRGTGFFSYSAPGGGNAIGNGYVDFGTGVPVKALDGIGMHFDGVASATVTELLVWFAQGDVIGTVAESFTGNIYLAAADSTPGASLASGTITTSDVNLAGFGSIPFGTAAAPAGADFVATVEWGSVLVDSLGVVGSADGDGLGEARVITLLSAASGAPGWFHGALYSGFDLDVMLLPVLDITAGGIAEAGNVTIKPVYPNPSMNEANINFGITTTDEVKITVFNMLGEVVFESSSTRVAGDHVVSVNTTDFSNGNYYFNVKTSSSQLTSKFIVAK
jgi:hypothetical protein